MTPLNKEDLHQDEYSLSRPTFNNGKLTVVGWLGKIGRIKKYVMECNVCSLDKELWPTGSITGPKGSLVKGQIPCGCRRARWKEFQQKVRVERECLKRGYIFNGWVGEFKGNTTKLKLHNPITDNDWETTTIRNFMYGKGDPIAGGNIKKTNKEATNTVEKLLIKEGHSFNGWITESKEYENIYSNFSWVCNKKHDCDTSYNDFVNKGSRCRTCKHINNPQMYGYYPERIHEKDYLYSFKIKNMNYFKVGRTFNKERRLKENQRRINDYYNTDEHTIYDVIYFTGTHQQVFDMEQELIGYGVGVFDDDRPEDSFGSSELITLDRYQECMEIIQEGLRLCDGEEACKAR